MTPNSTVFDILSGEATTITTEDDQNVMFTINVIWKQSQFRKKFWAWYKNDELKQKFKKSETEYLSTDSFIVKIILIFFSQNLFDNVLQECITFFTKPYVSALQHTSLLFFIDLH